MNHRSDVDGLRAIAILSVLLFHAGISGFIGGFVGVDIFFVISGFVIGGLVWRQALAGSFSLRAFYVRRARRLIPALLPVLLASTLAALWLFVPDDLISFGNNLGWTVIGASNLEFWHWSHDYFAPSTQLLPLLHAWSLGVEEQFYFVMPAVIFVICRHYSRQSVIIMLALLVGSFLFTLVASGPGSARFYFTPLRTWEFLCGVLICLPNFPRLRSRLPREVLSWLGLLAIAGSVLGYEPLPTLELLPCLGTMAIIYAGGCGPTSVNRMLSSRPAVFVGLISYSLYLWHWPLLVFARYWSINELPPTYRLAILALSGVVATLSWRFIESPFRRLPNADDKPRRLRRMLIPLAALGLLGVVLGHSQGLVQRLPTEAAALASGAENFDPRRAKCLLRHFDGSTLGPCVYGAPDVTPTIAVLGDSQAAALSPGLGKLAARSGLSFRLFAQSACRPALGFRTSDPSCDRHTRAAVDAILADPHLTTVVIVAEYLNSFYGSALQAHVRGRIAAELASGLPVFYTRPTVAPEVLFAQKFGDVVGELVRSGRRIVMTDPVPDVGVDVPSTLARLAWRGQDWPGFDWPRAYYEQRQHAVLAFLAAIEQANPALIRVHPQDLLCDTVRCRVASTTGSFYIDSYHLSLLGADAVAPAFSSIFRQDAQLP